MSGSEKHPEHDPVGSVAEEAARLFGALAGWAGEAEGPEPQADGGWAEQAASTFQDLVTRWGDAGEGESGAGSGSRHQRDQECRWCPLCRAVHAVQQVSPEAREHLRSAGASLLQALAAMAAPDSGTRPARSTTVEHIDLEDDGPPDAEEQE